MIPRALLAVTALASLGSTAAAREVSVRYTDYGVAHVRADDFEGLGYGYGWAFARDNLCLAIEHAVTLSGERSATMGPDGTYFDLFTNLGTGSQVSNIDSDVFFRAHLTRAVVAKAKRYASADARALIRGFARGINAHVVAAALPGEECRSQPWFRPLTEDDLWRRAVHIPILETSNLVLTQIVRAAPPGARQALRAPAPGAAIFQPGSNAAAFGSEMTPWRGGLSFSNPHFPWFGIERLHAVHLTVPGRYDVFGGTLYNFPVPMLGFNRSMGWSITYTTDQHTSVHRLDLVPGNPTQYRVDGRVEAMTPVTITIPAKTATGIEQRRRTMWKTRYGFVLAMPGMEWTAEHAYAIADPEIDNVRMLDGFLDVGRAGDVRQVKAALDRHMAFPWSNITAADAGGEVLYGNISLTPDIDDAKLTRCRVEIPASARAIHAIAPVLNGSDSSCFWTRDPKAVQPGTVPPERRPFTFRRDFVHNSNDSHWLPGWDRASALEGYAATIGDERTLRGERTRMGALMAIGRRDGSDGLGAAGIDAGKWEALFFRSRNLMAEILLDDVLADCRARPQVDLGSEGRVDLGRACAVLGRWDRTDGLQSRGGLLFREFLGRLERIPATGLKLADKYWRVPFDPADPINTPRGLIVSDETRAALARALKALEKIGIAPDAPLASVQFAERNGTRMPMAGNSYTYNMIIARPSPSGQGLTPVVGGDSYMHIVELRRDAPPQGRFIVTYSQSTNPRSPHFGDMTALYASQAMADVVFTDAQITAAQSGQTVRLTY